MRKTFVLVALVCMALATGCGGFGHTDSKGDTTLYTDDYNQTVAVPLSPKRIVSTSPAVTEIIYALGAEDLLVGRTDFCVFPAEAQSIESIGGISNLNVEKIVSLEPDLVISGSMIPRKASLQLEKMGVPIVCVIEKQTFDGLYENIEKIGQLTSYRQAADSLNRLLRSETERVTRELSAAGKDGVAKSVYYVVGYGSTGNFTAGGNSFINDIITMAGGRNIAADITGWSYSLEALMQADPDYVMIRREDSAAFCTTPPYNKLSAIKKGHVIAIESGTIDLQVPRNIDAIRFISRRLSE